MISITAGFIGVAALWFIRQWYEFEAMKAKLKTIPTIGSSNFMLSYFTALRFAFNGHKLLTEGYSKYPGSLFKMRVPTNPSGWVVVASGTQLVEDIRRASLDQLSFFEAASDSFGSKYLPGGRGDPSPQPYHFDVVRISLTRSFPARFDDLHDEIVAAAADVFGQSEDWTGVPLSASFASVVARTTNRLYVGLPLCRDENYLRVFERLTVDLFRAGNLLHLVPKPLKPLFGRLINPLPGALRELDLTLGPIVRERLKQEDAYGPSRPDRPKDLLSWLLDFAPEELRSVDDLISRFVSLNFVAVHTTSITLSNALFDLAEHQEYLQPLREEMEEMTNLYGWTKEAMNKMRKLDSFLKESSRLRGIGSTSMSRKVMKDFTLSNGTIIPTGCVLTVASRGLHHDPEAYANASTFDGYRFLGLRDNEEGGELKYQMVSLDHNYLLFGHGRSACPGRFFAVNEAKAILSHILLKYDIKFPEGVTLHPDGGWFSSSYIPDPSARLMFRRRL